jgi:hypothetical protein
MKQIFALFIAFAVGTIPTLARADQYKPQVIPLCTVYETKSGKEVCGYEYKGLPVAADEDWNKVLAADSELVMLREGLKKEQLVAANLREQVVFLRSQVKIISDSEKLIMVERSRLSRDLNEMNRKYENCRAKPSIGSPIAWGIALIGVSLAGGMALDRVLD